MSSSPFDEANIGGEGGHDGCVKVVGGPVEVEYDAHASTPGVGTGDAHEARTGAAVCVDDVRQTCDDCGMSLINTSPRPQTQLWSW